MAEIREVRVPDIGDFKDVPVIEVMVAPGDTVEAGQGLVVVEAMKMENELRAAKAGRVTSVSVTEGQSVDAGAVLAVVE